MENTLRDLSFSITAFSLSQFTELYKFCPRNITKKRLTNNMFLFRYYMSWEGSRKMCYMTTLAVSTERKNKIWRMKVELNTRFGPIPKGQVLTVNKKCGRFSVVDGRSISRFVAAYFIIFHTTCTGDPRLYNNLI